MAGIYLHIPFCKQKCNYCNFHFSTSLRGKDEMIAALHRELDLQQHYLSGQTLETVYFGGGTPSLLSADEISRLSDRIFRLFPNHSVREFTLEANPDDLTIPYLRALRNTPVSRFSIGVQSFRDADLLYMNRAHNASEADYAIKAAQDIGFSNITIDLIYGVPGLSDADWKANLLKVRDLELPHFSAYALTVEEGTLLHRQIRKKTSAPVDEGQSAGQFRILMAQAEVMGFEHYEISNLAKNGAYAIHNTNYWKGVPYLGIGPSAHSFDGRKRRWNIANNALYTQGILKDSRLIYEEEELTEEQRLNEYIMTSVRTIWGCELERIGKEYGETVATALEKDSESFRERGWATLTGDRRLVLTPEGKLYADHIAGELFR